MFISGEEKDTQKEVFSTFKNNTRMNQGWQSETGLIRYGSEYQIWIADFDCNIFGVRLHFSGFYVLLNDTLLGTPFFKKTRFFYNQGPYETLGPFVNFCSLELTYRAQTFRDYSFSYQLPCEKRSNSIINIGTSVRPF